ncbi:fatty acid desaturase [Alsobacter sp. R-9]
MSLDQIQPIQRLPAVEWPTVALFVVIYGLWLALTWLHDALPLWLWLPLAAWTAAWWGSAQHEALHGHPTRNRALNTALATPPFWLWLPFECYRRSHLIHHCDERLTDPLDDPESRYWTAEGWRELGPLGRRLVGMQGTLLGRLVIGPLWSIGHFWLTEVRKALAGDEETIRNWSWHVLWVGLLAVWVIAVCDMPVWQYLLGFVYCGTSLALVRSFAEHKARDAVDQRTAIVERAPVLGLLFLHNNLHVVHHRWPTLPWYRLPEVYGDYREAVLESNGGLVYRGYAEVFRRFLLTRHDAPVHPTGRAAFRDGSMPDAKDERQQAQAPVELQRGTV